RKPGSDQNIASGVASKIKTMRIRNANRVAGRVLIWLRVAVSSPKRHVRRGRDSETLGFDVVVRVPGIHQGLASWTREPIGESPRIATTEALRVARRSPRCGKGNT